MKISQNSITLLVVCFFVGVGVFSCTNKEKHPIVEQNLCNIPSEDVALMGHTTESAELYVPMELLVVGDYIAIVNGYEGANVIYLYNRHDLQLIQKYGTFGRAANEYFRVGKAPKNSNDSTFYLYTNNRYCAELSVKKNGEINELRREKITDNIGDNVIILNDSITFSRIRGEKYPFKLYNRNQNDVSFLGEFPQGDLDIDNIDDRDNWLVSTSVYSPFFNRLLVFYANAPIIGVYDMSSMELIRETVIKDANPQCSSLDEFYDNLNNVYFYKPVTTEECVYVAFVNGMENKEPSSLNLLVVNWDGVVSKSYNYDIFSSAYTVSADGCLYLVSQTEDGLLLHKAQLCE